MYDVLVVEVVSKDILQRCSYCVKEKGGGAKSEREAFVVVILTSPLQA